MSKKKAIKKAAKARRKALKEVETINLKTRKGWKNV